MITPQQLVERLERASPVAGWDALANPGQWKTDEFFLSLRDNALSWYNMLDNIIGYNKEDWDELKKKFLEAYAPKYSAKALCICFQDLRQKSDESVQDFYNKVSERLNPLTRSPCQALPPRLSATWCSNKALNVCSCSC